MIQQTKATVLTVGKIQFSLGDVISIGSFLVLAGFFFATTNIGLAQASEKADVLEQKISEVKDEHADAIEKIYDRLEKIEKKQVDEQVKTAQIQAVLESTSAQIDRIADKLDAD